MKKSRRSYSNHSQTYKRRRSCCITHARFNLATLARIDKRRPREAFDSSFDSQAFRLSVAPTPAFEACNKENSSTRHKAYEPDPLLADQNDGDTIQFGSVDFHVVVVRTVTIPVNDMNMESSVRKLHPIGAPIRCVHLPAPRPTAKNPHRKIFPLTTHSSNLPAQEPVATIPTRNGFANLKWELKRPLWEQQRDVPALLRKSEPETLSARVYRVLKTVKERGLKKRRYQ
ncbi:hypothetical protein M5K25_008490 [Dendrobium thyrsiflorum]|uniref:Uncharacterized protein n=1 Tax=Dendrobium thyrsiflorum TaxID=117978 RepID=A0ABD0V8K5_DENTH